MLEREIKLPFQTCGDARAAVVASGATCLHERRLQDDALFDTAEQTLRQRGCVLRLRVQPGEASVTFKGPASVAGGMKVREEHETAVADAAVFRLVLEGLGFRAWFRYQKFREEFAAPGVVIAVDETPVGVYVEIEGEAEAVSAAAHALGRDPADFISDSYYRLFLARRERHGIRGEHMLFGER